MPDWEIVGKKKKEIKLTRKEKKKEEQEFINTAPKLEELLPHSQVVSLYANLTSTNAKNAKPNKPVNKENEKKNQKKLGEKKKKASHSNPTSEKPRNLEVAVANVKYEELKNNYEIAKIRFDENPLFQLKALTAFLSSKLVVDQNKIVFTGKCLEHPLGMFPDKHRHFIHSVFNEVGKEVRYQFFDTCLLALVSDMKQGNPISGYKVMLQSLVSHYPEVVYENFDLISDLIQGYTSPNKITISTTIMWVIAQAGNYNFKHGLQVWRTFMLSFIEQKNYTRYSLDYLKHLFTRHHIKRDALSIPEYLEYVDLLFQGYVIPKACVTELQSSCKLFRERTSLEDAGKYFLMVLEERIPQPGSALYRQETVAFLYSLLREDPHACFTQWRNVYVNNLPESVLLLRLIYKDWKKIQSDGILPYKETKYTIETFHLINQSMYKKKIHCEGLDECNRIIETLTTKMTVSKSSPLRWLILISLMALSAFVAYDVSLHGSFQKSQTGQALKDAGVLKTYEQLSVKAKIQYANASKWFSKNGPTFLKQTADYIKPYLVLMKNLLIVFSNAVVNGVITFVKYLAVKLPLLHQAIESYCPGITEMAQKAALSACQGFLQLAQYVVAQSLTILTVVLQYLRQVFAQTLEYLQKNVFVGDYSPENLQKMAFQGVSVAQEYISSSVTWLSHKLSGLANQ